MKNKSSAVIVLDENGKVLFAKDGPLSEIEVKRTIKLIETHLS
jgi:predicted transcriptional regulator